MDSSNPIQTFLAEAAELLDRIEESALEVEQNPRDLEAVNRLFRAFHTIKGSGAMFGFDQVAAFTHHVESTLDRVRTGTLEISARLVQLLLASRDHIKDLLERRGAGAGREARSTELVAAFAALTAGAVAAAPAAPETVVPAASAPPDEEPASTWRIRFRPAPGLGAVGLDPLTLLDDLRSLGTAEVTALTDAVPPLESLDPEQCYLSWEIVLTTTRGFNAIKDVFIFVEDDSSVAIERIPVAAEPAVLSPAAPAVASAALPPSPPAPAAPAAPALAATPAATTSRSERDASIRVPSARLDRLVNLVGELVMNQSRLIQIASRIDQAELTAPVEDLERLIGEVRDTVLGIRMMPIGTTFTRFKRLVHDLSGELKKEISLVTEGAETELDKTVLDQLGDPLVHLIRNSIDHGIEPPDERIRAGKPRSGVIRLTAVHAGSNVLITIQDDGRGLDPDLLRAKAIERKLITPDAVLTQRELFALILLPGFSTAKSVTAVSGRGVGMDVVKREIDALGGSLEIASERGRGTTITATLPLTLAIIDGLLVEIAGDPFIIPMSAVQENVELARVERTRHNGRNTVAVRGELVPYIFLREAFAVTGEEPELEKIVIVRHGTDRVGLVVDRVLGSHQTVIQSLGRFYRHISVLSGATIMGDGRVALILDLGGLINRVESLHAAARAA